MCRVEQRKSLVDSTHKYNESTDMSSRTNIRIYTNVSASASLNHIMTIQMRAAPFVSRPIEMEIVSCLALQALLSARNSHELYTVRVFRSFGSYRV